MPQVFVIGGGDEPIVLDEYTKIGFRITVNSGKTIPMIITKSNTATLTIDWGDGDEETTSSNGIVITSHAYADYGDYEVKMWISSGTGTYKLGNGSSLSATQTIRDTILYCYVGTNVTEVRNSFFTQCNSITVFKAPDGVALTYNVFQNAKSLSTIEIGSGTTNIRENCFQNTKITSLVIPATVATISANAFKDCIACKTYIIEKTDGVITLSATDAFSGINSSTKIYVPDALVNDYKIASNWSTYANYIYPISEKGVTHND
jgi:hypothetical protein